MPRWSPVNGDCYGTLLHQAATSGAKGHLIPSWPCTALWNKWSSSRTNPHDQGVSVDSVAQNTSPFAVMDTGEQRSSRPVRVRIRSTAAWCASMGQRVLRVNAARSATVGRAPVPLANMELASAILWLG